MGWIQIFVFRDVSVRLFCIQFFSVLPKLPCQENWLNRGAYLH
jgi:hypothetical protein